MWSPKSPKLLASSLLVLAGLILLVALQFPRARSGTAREQFLRFVPADATSVFFFDLEGLRNSPFLAALYSWAPQPAEDSEYAQFVRDTGFQYERDLSEAFIAISNRGNTSETLVLAEGKFDQAKLAAFLGSSRQLVQRGNLKVYTVPVAAKEKPLYIALLSSKRVAITNSENLFATLSDAVRQAGPSEWQARFDRLAGSPAFAVIRQDRAVETVLGSAAPGGYRSPQLAALIQQLQWISIAAKPQGDILRIVADLESSSETTASQLSDFLQGIQLLAQDGLNDPKLRQRIKPEEREAYLELLKSAEVQKINRGSSKSVRLILSVTPQFLSVANIPKVTSPSDENSAQPLKPVIKKPAAKSPKSSGSR